MIGQPGALWIPSPSYSHMNWPYDGGKPKWIIVHGTASGINYPAQATARDFQTAGISTHYVVGYDGTIVQCVDEAAPAWGNGVISGPAGVAVQGNSSGPHDAFWDTAGHHDPNGCTISIEHSRSSDNTSPLSNAQLSASFNLIAGICARWGIPRQYANANGGITGHFSIDPVHRAFCPGPYPWAQLINYLGGHGGLPGNLQLAQNATAAPGVASSQPPLTQLVHQTLTNTPGFYGMALALDEAEQFPGWIDLTVAQSIDIPLVGTTSVPDVSGGMRSLGVTIQDNFLPFAIRSGITLLGLALLLALIIKPIHSIVQQVP